MSTLVHVSEKLTRTYTVKFSSTFQARPLVTGDTFYVINLYVQGKVDSLLLWQQNYKAIPLHS